MTSSLTRGISSEELDALKCNAPSVIGESLMKKILEINQVIFFHLQIKVLSIILHKT